MKQRLDAMSIAEKLAIVTPTEELNKDKRPVFKRSKTELLKVKSVV